MWQQFGIGCVIGAGGTLVGYWQGRRARAHKISRAQVLPEMDALDAIARLVWLSGGYRARLLAQGRAVTVAPPARIAQKVEALLASRNQVVTGVAMAVGLDPVTTPVDAIVRRAQEMRAAVDQQDRRRFWDNVEQGLEQAILLPGHRARMVCEIEPQPQWPAGKAPIRISNVRGGMRDGRNYTFPVPQYLMHASVRIDVIQMQERWCWVSYVAQAADLTQAA